MDYGLKDKVVLITGSTGGIGQALCRAFAAEGCKLAISSTAQEKLDAFVPTLDIAPEKLATFICDVTKEDEVKAFVDGAYAAFGSIDVVIPNAGYEGEYQLIQDCTYESYMKVYGVKRLRRCLHLQIRRQVHDPAGQGRGRGHSLQRQLHHRSRHERLLLQQARRRRRGEERGPRARPPRIHCNYICPGGVETPIDPPASRRTPSATPRPTRRCEQIFGAAYLDKRYCRADEVANLALYSPAT